MAFGIDDAIAAGLKIVDKFIPDPAEKAKAAQALRSDLMAWDGQQAQVNAAEAANPNMFVAGWRPFIGWVCGAALTYSYIVVPIGTWIAQTRGIAIGKPPVLDGNLWELVTAMLGMSGLRTYEKLSK